MLPTEQPFKAYVGRDGKPLDNGYIYFGVANQNPMTAPVSVFWDTEGTQPAAQPLRILNGYVMRAGTPANVYCDVAYSILVQDSMRRQVSYARTSDDFSVTAAIRILIASLASSIGSSLINTIQAGIGAISRTLQDKGRDHLSVKDFGAIGNGIADDTLAIQKTIDRIKAIGGGQVYFPIGTYKISARLVVSGNFGFSGIELRGNRATILSTHNGEAFYIKPSGVSSPDAASEYRQNTLVHGFTIQGPGKALTASVGVQIQQGADVQVRDCTIQNFYRGLHGVGALICHFHNLLIQRNDFGIDFLRIVAGGGGHAPEFGPNDIHFDKCKVIDNIHAIRCYDFPNGVISFDACEIEGNNLLGTAADGVRVVEFFNAGKVLMKGCHFEENPGQYNIWFHGENAGSHLTMIGGEVIPGNLCGNCLFLSNASGAANAASAFISGTRITNGVGQQLYVSEGFKVAIIGEIGGLVSGFLANVTYIRGGRVISGTNESSLAQAKFVGDVNGIAVDMQGASRFVNAAGTRVSYSGHNGADAYVIADTGGVLIGTNAGQRVHVARLGALSLEAAGDNTYSLGTAALRWGTVFAGAGSINTSDGRAKQQVAVIDSGVLRAWSRVDYCQFKFNDAAAAKGGAARLHFGVIAQQVKTAFEAEGLDPFAYGVLCYDEWADYYVDALDENGEQTGEQRLQIAAGNRYGIRYEEALVLECALMRNRLAALGA